MGVTIKKKGEKAAATGKALVVTPEFAVHRDGWKQYSRLDSLGAMKVDYLRAQLIKGIPPRVVAKFIQTDWGDLTEVSVDALADTLQAWRDKHVMPAIASGLLAAVKKKIPAALERLDTMNEMIDLILLQKGRLYKMYIKEEQSPLLMQTVSNELTSLAIMLEKLAKLQLETGVLKRAPRVMQGTLTAEGPDGEQKGKVSIQWSDQADKEFEDVLIRHKILKGEHVIEASSSDAD